MYEIIVLETARFRPAVTKTPLEEASSKKKNAVYEEKEEKLPVFFFLMDMRGRPDLTVYTKANVRQSSKRPSRDYNISYSRCDFLSARAGNTFFFIFLARWPYVEL